MPAIHDRATILEIRKSLVHDHEFEQSRWVGNAVPSPAHRRRASGALAGAALLAAVILIIAESFGTAMVFLAAAIALGLAHHKDDHGRKRGHRG